VVGGDGGRLGRRGRRRDIGEASRQAQRDDQRGKQQGRFRATFRCHRSIFLLDYAPSALLTRVLHNCDVWPTHPPVSLTAHPSPHAWGDSAERGAASSGGVMRHGDALHSHPPVSLTAHPSPMHGGTRRSGAWRRRAGWCAGAVRCLLIPCEAQRLIRSSITSAGVNRLAPLLNRV
jgi:hypothetical protein